MFDRKEYQKQYYKDHREKINKRSKEWGRANLEKKKESQRRSMDKTKRVYRSIIMESLGCDLKHGETVHHIDMDKANNKPENLYIYRNTSQHFKGHVSMNELVAGLLEDNIVEFVNGGYYRILY